MDLNYINPFIQAANEIISEVVGVEIKKDELYIRKGKTTKNGVGIILDVNRDVDGRIIFDFTTDMVSNFAEAMIGLNISNEEDIQNNKDMVESAIKELGNMISGRAITLLEDKGYDCNINPPEVYLGKDIVLADSQHICIVIDFTSEFGAFSLCLTNKGDTYLDSISLVLYNMNEYIQDALVFAFLPKGFEMFGISDKNDLLKILTQKDIDFLFINTDKLGENYKEELKAIKGRSKKTNTKLVAFTSKKDLSEFEGLFDETVSFIIPNYFTDSEVIISVKKFFETAGIRHSERRKHVRIDIPSSETIKINFPVEEGAIVEGVIKNLSIGGALFECKDIRFLNKLHIGKRVEGLQMSLEGRIVRASAIVVYRKDSLSAVRFVEIKESFLKIISKYIFKKLSDIIKTHA